MEPSPAKLVCAAFPPPELLTAAFPPLASSLLTIRPRGIKDHRSLSCHTALASRDGNPLPHR